MQLHMRQRQRRPCGTEVTSSHPPSSPLLLLLYFYTAPRFLSLPSSLLRLFLPLCLLQRPARSARPAARAPPRVCRPPPARLPSPEGTTPAFAGAAEETTQRARSPEGGPRTRGNSDSRRRPALPPAAPGGTGLPAAQPALPRERRARREEAAAGAAGPMPAANLMESLQPPALQVPGPQGAPEGGAVWSSASTPSLRRRRFKLRRARNVLERSLEAGLARELPLPGGAAPGKELLQLPAIEITPSSDEDTPWSNCSTPSASPRRKRFLLRKWLRLRERKECGESRYVRVAAFLPHLLSPPSLGPWTPRGNLRGIRSPSPTQFRAPRRLAGGTLASSLATISPGRRQAGDGFSAVCLST